jgi:hypothetical protein
MDWRIGGAFAFGTIIGWYVYFVNRYRAGEVTLGDITTVIGTIGGGAVLALFEKSSELFGAYGVGLASGFFGYFFVLSIRVLKSPNFDSDWFLDGRRKDPAAGYGYGQGQRPTVAPMAPRPPGVQGPSTDPGGGAGFYGQNPGRDA